MEKNRGIIRELLKFEFELGHSTKEAMDNINRAKGNGTASKATAYLWYSKFRSNKMDIEDKKRFGRPREVDRVAVVNTVEAHPSMTTRIGFPRRQCQAPQIATNTAEDSRHGLGASGAPAVQPGPFSKRLLPIPIVGTLVARKKGPRMVPPWDPPTRRTVEKVIESGGEYFDY
uniref:Mos1 transposase HTH domain-containing protein n=1 Tax=Acrobeloides nanus TaxID=290746 RepID=A0A914CSA6_9BILA